jgi:hypothetical protein
LLSSRAFSSPLYSGIAQSTPLTPRTASSFVSWIGFTSSMNCTFGSITHTSGSPTSVIALYVRSISPTKIAACCVINSDANVSPMMIPKYFARSPTSILKATTFIPALPVSPPQRRAFQRDTSFQPVLATRQNNPRLPHLSVTRASSPC